MSDDLDLRAVDQRHEPDPEFRAALQRRVAEIVAGEQSADAQQNAADVEAVEVEFETQPTSRRRLRSAFLGAVAAAAAVIVIVVAVTASNESKESPPADDVNVTTPEPDADDSRAFADAIDASGLLRSPSPTDVEQATNAELYKSTGPASVSTAGNYVSLLECRERSTATCGSSPAYVTGTARGADVNVGVLRGASSLDLSPLDDRYFVAAEYTPDAEVPSKAFLIDAVSGRAGLLSWRDEPTTLNAPAQALLLTTASSEAGLPKVVDARDGTIRPLARLDDGSAQLSVAQRTTDRIWVGTKTDRDEFGLAFSDDGGATWSDVALPEPLRLGSEDGLKVAADGEHVAATTGGLSDGAVIYVSNDAGQTWTTATNAAELGQGNGARLFVLSDGRLALLWSFDASPHDVLVSTGFDWNELESRVADHAGWNDFSVNAAGVATVPAYIEECATTCGRGDGGSVFGTLDFSIDLKDWSTIETLDDWWTAPPDPEALATYDPNAGPTILRVDSVEVTVECADTIEGDFLLGGTVTDDPEDQGLAVTDGDVAVGDRVALILREGSGDSERVALYADASAGSCTELLESAPADLDDSEFRWIKNGTDVQTVAE